MLLVSNGFPPSGQWGTEYYTHQLATGLAARGHELVVMCPVRDRSRSRYTIEREVRYGIPLVQVHNAGDPRKRFADSYQNERVEAILADLVAEERPDVVHFTHLLWGLSVRLPEVCARAGVPRVVTLADFGLLCHRGQLFDERLEQCGGPHAPARCARCIRTPGRFASGAATRAAKGVVASALAAVGGLGLVVTSRDLAAREAAVREALRAVDHFVAPTRILAYAFSCAGVPRDRVTQLAYGIDERPYREAARRVRTGDHRFGFLGQFEPHKGLHRLFEAVELLERRLPESVEAWCVHLFGNPVGGRSRGYVDRIWRRALARRIHFRGSFEPLEAPRILAGLDAVIVPSQWAENAPLTVLQARIAGVPVIASDVPGIREVLDERHGELVDPADPRALAEAMARRLRAGRVLAEPAAPPVTHAEHLDRIEGIYRLVQGGARLDERERERSLERERACEHEHEHEHERAQEDDGARRAAATPEHEALVG